MASLRIRTRLGLVALLGVPLAACTLSGGIDLPSRNDGESDGGFEGPGVNSGAENSGGAGGLGGAGGVGGSPEAGDSP